MIKEVNMTTKQVEQKEFEEIDAILSVLWKKGLITDIDCRIIKSCNTPMEKKGAVYTVIMSKTKEEAANLTEIFRKMTVTIHAKENSLSLPNINSNDDQNYVLPPVNPLMNNIIIKHLFGFLPLKDMKQFRLVCREWNSTAEICLRKRSAIAFRPKVLLPRTFMDIAKYSQPDLPFSSFAFFNNKTLGWYVSDIQDFLEKWEKNIKEVSFKSIKLVRKSNVTHKDVVIHNYDISPLFINPSNITSLKINPPGIYHRPKTLLDIFLEKFVSIKTVDLTYCRIILSPKNEITRIAPHNVLLDRVLFTRKGKLVKHFHYNDLFDFNKAININLEQIDKRDGTLDMGQPEFNLNRLHLVSVTLKNWTQAKGSVEFLRLCDIPFVEKNHLKIKLLIFIEHTIDLNALPQTLEVLQFSGSLQFVCNESLYLPNLKYVRVDVRDSASLIYFSNCANFVELEIRNDTPITQPYKFSLGWVPKSVKKIKMQLLQITFSNDSILELDTLILECGNVLLGVKDCTALTAQIKANVIVFVCSEEFNIDTSDFEKLVAANKQVKNIMIVSNLDGSTSNSVVDDKSPFEGSDLAQYVDKKVNNQAGVFNEEFVKYNMKDYFSPYFS